MDTVLLDTNVVSFLEKRDTRAELYRHHLDGRRHAVCFVSVAELYQWAIRHKWGGPRISSLRQRLSAFLVIPFDDALAWEWAAISSTPGRPVAVADAWIAAAARLYGLPLVTHNRRHFEGIAGVTVVSEAP